MWPCWRETVSHDNVDEDTKSAGDQHYLRLDLCLPGEDSDESHVDQDHGHHPDQEDSDIFWLLGLAAIQMANKNII